MARRGRRGSLSPKTYFPATGDQLQMEDMLWECAKSNTVSTPQGEKIRYAMLFGFPPGEDCVIPMVIHDQNDSTWTENLLEETQTIHRRIPGETVTFRIYDWSKEAGTWQQRLDES